MVIIEILGGVVFLALVGATIIFMLIGGLGLLGVVLFERCPECRRFSVQSKPAVQPCVRCRQSRLHPLRSRAHVGFSERQQAA